MMCWPSMTGKAKLLRGGEREANDIKLAIACEQVSEEILRRIDLRPLLFVIGLPVGFRDLLGALCGVAV